MAVESLNMARLRAAAELELRRRRNASAASSYEWVCSLPECDGEPHEDRPYKHARTSQRPPEGYWDIWLILAGRGWGKTRTGSETFLDMVLADPVDTEGRATWWLIGSETYADTVELMFEGVSSLSYAMERRGIKYTWNKVDKRITLSTGQKIVMQYAEGNDDFGRGPSWAGAWIDEIGVFKRIKKAWEESLPFAMRAMLPGDRVPKILLTTTPKAETKESFEILKALVKEAEKDTTIRVTKGSTFENRHNIPAQKLAQWEKKYPEGTRIRKQELEAELMDNVEGSLWTMELIEATRKDAIEGEVIRRYVGLDASGTDTKVTKNDLAGLVLVAKTMKEEVREEGDKRPAKKEAHYWVEKDLTAKASVSEWAKNAVVLANAHSAAIAYETNYGADLVAEALKSAAKNAGIPCPRLIPVRANESKALRAGTVVGLYEEGRVHHVGVLGLLEHEMTTWVPESPSARSPNRIDAMVHAVMKLDKPAPVSVPARSMW